jgi:hypothetical protein
MVEFRIPHHNDDVMTDHERDVTSISVAYRLASVRNENELLFSGGHINDEMDRRKLVQDPTQFRPTLHFTVHSVLRIFYIFYDYVLTLCISSPAPPAGSRQS